MLMDVPDDGGVAAIIERSVGRMQRLIHDLLSLSRVEAQSRGAVCDPAGVAAQVRDEQAARAETAQATLRIDVEPARVHADEGLLVEALTNLTDNATKYARPGVPAAIVIRGRARDDSYELAVADNGMGMSPEEVRQAFTPFYRAKRAPKTPGTGLGLSIVKRVAEASGGSVAVESTLGQGSTFVLRLRIARDGDVG
jgi:signal transduction histidine kinase